jgi:putative adhesin
MTANPGAGTTTSLPPTTNPGGPRQDAGTRASLRILAVGLSVLMVGWGALTLASLLARVTEDRSATYPGVRTLDIDVGFESVQIVGSADATSVSMQRSYTWSLGKPTIGETRNGDLLSITSSCPFTVGLGCSGHVRVVVPHDIKVRARTSDGSLTVRDLDGRVDLAATDGGIAASGLTGRATIHTSDGSIAATELRSDQVDASTSDGSMRLQFEAAPAAVTARSSDGSIDVVVPHDGTAYDVAATTGDGGREVAVPTDPDSSHRMELRTSDGSIRLLARS